MSAPRGRLAAIWRVTAGTVLLGAVAFALVTAVRGEGGTALAEVARPENAGWLLAALTANAAGVWLSMLSWRVLVTDPHRTADRTALTRVFFIGLISKFVPGRIWGLLAHLHLGKAAGLSADRVVSAFFLSLVIGLASGAGLGLLVAPATLGGYAWATAPLVLLGAVGLARPGWVNKAVALALRLVRRREVAPHGSDAALRRSLAAALGSWTVSGLHLWILVILLGAPPLTALPLCLGGFALATVAGSLAFVLPDGYGARELVLLLPLAQVMPLPTATVAVVLSRVVCVVSEAAFTGGVLVWARRRNGSPGPPVPANAA